MRNCVVSDSPQVLRCATNFARNISPLVAVTVVGLFLMECGDVTAADGPKLAHRASIFVSSELDENMIVFMRAVQSCFLPEETDQQKQ